MSCVRMVIAIGSCPRTFPGGRSSGLYPGLDVTAVSIGTEASASALCVPLGGTE